MDLAEAKQQLGVDPNLNPKDYDERQSSGTLAATFDDAALKLFGYLTGVGQTPAAAAIDHGLATAAVTGTLSSGGRIVILATPQPPARIKAGLVQAGYRSTGAGVYMDPARCRARISTSPPLARAS